MYSIQVKRNRNFHVANHVNNANPTFNISNNFQILHQGNNNKYIKFESYENTLLVTRQQQNDAESALRFQVFLKRSIGVTRRL